MLVMRPTIFNGRNAENDATKKKNSGLDREGVCSLGWISEKTLGSSPSRDMESNTRDWPSSITRITEVKPQTMPNFTRLFIHRNGVLSMASAAGAATPSCRFGLVFMGLYDGLAIAFLVGRFDSHWMKVPRWMLAPLYGYALIQMIYVFFFTVPPEWQVYTYLVALLFKVCQFVVVTHPLHAGNIALYLEAAEDGKLGPQGAS
jgi:hypothetical protein